MTDELGACIGIPGINPHRCVFADGPVTGKRVLVHGVPGSVGSMAAQLARWNGARMGGTVRHAGEISEVDTAVCGSVVALDRLDPVRAVRAVPDGVDRIIEVSL